MDLIEKVRLTVGNEYKDVKKCVLAYSGGLDSTVILSILQELGIEVVTVSVDFGQNAKMADVRKRAQKFVKKHYTVEGKPDLVRMCGKGVKTNCVLEGYINSGAFTRPLMAQYLVEVAKQEGADAVAHGSSGMGNDQLRMDNGIKALGPHLHIMAPVRDWDLRRDEAHQYARSNSLLADYEGGLLYSVDENLWARKIRLGKIIDHTTEIPADAYEWAVDPADAPDKKTHVEVHFENGIPTGVAVMDGKGRKASSQDVIGTLNKVGGANGIGRMDYISDKVIGLKTREACECPAGLILCTAHKELERLTLTSSELNVKNYLDNVWNGVVHDGHWYSRLRVDLDAFIDKTQEACDGSVMLSLYKGGFEVIGRKSKHALYDSRLGSRDSNSTWDQKASRYYSKIYGLQETIAFVMDTS